MHGENLKLMSMKNSVESVRSYSDKDTSMRNISIQ